MKQKLLVVFSAITLIVLGLFLNTKFKSVDKMDELRAQHVAYLNNSPFKETLQLSKKERKAKGIPPNKYMEEQWELTMDPNDGQPHPERLFDLQERLKSSRVPGENTNDWTERGPDNVGGRTRAIMFDPNDSTNKRVFAGGVSGGLWVNNDITNANSAWSLVDMPQNLAVSCITYDPNDSNIFYVGTGESYVQGAVNGNGLWKSTDAGQTWTKVFGGVSGATTFESNATLTVNTPAGISGDYAAILATAFGTGLTTPVTGNLVLVDDGSGTPDDGCQTLVNGADISGNIAVVRRGDCNFTLKVQNAEIAGAIAVVVVNNVSGPPIPMGAGTSPPTINIPSIMVSINDGNTIIAELSNGVNATMQLSGSPYTGSFVVPGVQHINDVIVRNNGGSSEIYVAAGETFYGDSTPSATLGGIDYGLYKSLDNGATWTKLTLPNTPQGDAFEPNDIEIAADNKIWVGTTGNIYGNGGGTILSSPDGVTFTVRRTVTNGRRTQIAVSGTNSGTIYSLTQVRTVNAAGTDLIAPFVALEKTTTEFGRTSFMQKPNDADADISADDFTRNQAFYDLTLEVDPTDDTVLYVGGIDLFKTTDTGVNWSQLSHWYGGYGFQEVHSDQHAIAFANNSTSTMLFSNDGGVYYSNNGGTTISARNKNYNTLQFYKGAIGSDSANEKLLAGAQDNGSQFINNATAGINSSSEISGGDGAYVFIDKDNEYMITSYVYNVYYYKSYATGSTIYTIANDQSNGGFINHAALDSANNILYADGTTGGSSPTYQIFRYTLGTNSASKYTMTNALMDRGRPTAFKPSTFTTTTLFVGTADSKLFKITGANTGSGTWTEISGPDFFGSISCIELGATENDIYVTFYNYGVTSIFYSNDGGATWQNKEGNFPDIPVRAILPNPLNNNEVIIGTDLGVWGTPDFSAANPVWSQSQNGMKDVIVTSFDLRSSDNTVLASTYGRGMFTGQFTADASGLSVDEYAQNNLIKIYPTVSDGNITIKSISDVREGNFTIFDINGRTIYSSKLDFDNGLEKRLSLNLSAGMYVAKFDSNGIQSSQKIVIK